MKKFYFMLTALILAFAAHAAKPVNEWYVKLYAASHNNWAVQQVQPNSDGVASWSNITLGTGEFNYIIYDGSSDVKYTINGDNHIAPGSYAMKQGEGSIWMKDVDADAKFNIELDFTNMTMTYTLVEGGDSGEEGEGGETSSDTYTIVGAFSDANWAIDSDSRKFELVDNVLTYTGSFNAGTEFKVVKNHSWNSCWSTQSLNMTDNAEYTNLYTSGSNMAFASSGTYTLKFYPAEPRLVVGDPDNQGGGDETTDVYKFVLYGTISTDGWSVTALNNEDNTWSTSFTATKEFSFGIRQMKNNSDEQTAWFACTDNNGSTVEISADKTNYGIGTTNCGNFTGKAGEYTISFTADANGNVTSATINYTPKDDSGDEGEGDNDGTFTVYVLNDGEWPNVNAYVWNQVGSKVEPFGTWPGQGMTISTDKAYVINGQQYELYTISFTGDRDSYQVIFNGNGQTGDLTLVNNGVYSTSSKDLITTGELVTLGGGDDDEEGELTRIYFNAGAALPNAVTFRFWKGDSYTDLPGEKDPTLPRLRIYQSPEIDAAKYDNVQIIVTYENDTVTLNTGVDGFDSQNWAKYIYGTPEYITAGSYVYQSYFTYDEFKALWLAEKPAVYVCGANIEGASWNPEYAISFETNEDVATIEFTYKRPGEGETTNPLFKMSWVNLPEIISNLRNSGYIGADEQYDDAGLTTFAKRAWATFNLGIIGSSTDLAVEGDTDRTFYRLEYPKQYDVYSQNNWAANNANTELHDNTTYWIVVDTDNDLRTVTMVDFDPRPSITEATAEFVGGYEFEPQDGLFLKGAQNSGARAYITEANRIQGTVKVSVPNLSTEKAERFDLKYLVVTDGQFTGSIDPDDMEVDEETGIATLEIPYMGLESDLTINIQALYTSPAEDNNMKFRGPSRNAKVTTEGVEFPAPEFGGVNFKRAYQDKGYVGAHVDVSFNVSNSNEDMVWFPDFELSSDKADASAAIPAHEGLAYFSYAEEAQAHGHNGVNFVPFTESNYSSFAPENHWSQLAKDSQTFRLYLDKAFGTDDDYKDANERTVNLTLYAAYPLIVPEVGSPLQVASNKAGRRKVETLQENSGLTFTVIHAAAAPETISFAATDLSGITDATVANSADVEYYNLQGVKVEGELAPGIYIRRAGNTVEKVAIR